MVVPASEVVKFAPNLLGPFPLLCGYNGEPSGLAGLRGRFLEVECFLGMAWFSQVRRCALRGLAVTTPPPFSYYRSIW